MDARKFTQSRRQEALPASQGPSRLSILPVSVSLIRLPKASYSPGGSPATGAESLVRIAFPGALARRKAFSIEGGR
ncbi:MAG TPA: hypothetical protein DIC34_01415 [Treponema sp.]|nr:hypothetical protein [Treponema sp.]